MSNILQDFFRERNKKRGFDGAVDKFLDWQAGRPEEEKAYETLPYVPDPEATGKEYSNLPYTIPENPSDEPNYELLESDYMKGADQLLPPMAVPAEGPDEPPVDEPPVDMPLIQQLQESGMLGPGDDKQPAREPESQEEYTTMYPRPDEQLHPNKSPKQQQYGPNSERQDELSTEYDSGPAPSHLGGGFEGASTKDILSGKAPLTMDSLGLPDYDLPEFETGADGTVGTGWRDADLKPLPGEETLHPDILKWADTNKTAGGTGLQGLRQAYMNDVGAGQEGRDSISFQEWLESKGFDPYNEMGYRGNREALNRMAPMPGLGGSGVDSHRARLRKQKVIGSYLQRYGDESVLSTPMTRDDAEALYDKAYADALANGENPVLAAGRALHGYSQEFQQNKDAQLRQNVSNRASQMHRAQRFGVPVGLVAAVDQYRNAGDDPLKQQQALLMGAMQYPQVFLPIYQAQAYATNQASLIAGMNASGGTGGVTPPAAPPGTFAPGEERPQEVAPSYATNEHVQTARLQGLQKGGASHLIPVTSALPPEEGRRIFATTFPRELETAKNTVLSGQEVTPEEAQAIRNYLGPNPTIEDMRQVFGPISDEDYETLRAYFTGTSEQGWGDWLNSFSVPDWMIMDDFN